MFETILNNAKMATLWDVVDILLVAFLFYRLMRFLRNTNAQKLFQGLIAMVVITILSDLAQLHVIYYIMETVMQVGILALVIIFQPELRKMLEQFGSSKLSNLFSFGRNQEARTTDTAILQTIEAVNSLAWTKTGALIIFQREDSLQNIINTGTTINADVNAELLKNLFYNKAPLHDGAVVIADGRIAAAGCILPLSGKQNISKDLGTRHRAGLGQSENYDSLSVIVSEETGGISLAEGGILKQHLAPETLERLLTAKLMPEEDDQKPNLLERVKGWISK
ncbi:MAG: diadenylate cyclase CdaA [Clostridiaceae bacterium]|nr:diadenylate cyclase CdaA [Clostridia bacterium]MDD7312335.1 diadenylate cyclase CdaA [Clostridia bacterium]MDY3869737.1 diadenylate cyclase CdaA [Clostridiaceae bacterium]